MPKFYGTVRQKIDTQTVTRLYDLFKLSCPADGLIYACY